MRAGLKQGGSVLGALIIEREDASGYAIYLRTDWVRGRAFRGVQTWRGRESARLFKSVDVALRFIRRFGFFGSVTVYRESDQELSQFAGVAEGRRHRGASDARRTAKG